MECCNYSESEVTQSCPTLRDPWTVAHQAPLSMGFSRQEYWSGLPFPSPGDLPDPGIELRSPTLQADAVTSAPPGKPLNTRIQSQKTSYRDSELQIQVLTSKISREERKPGWKKGRRQERGAKGVALQMSPAIYRYPGIMWLFPGPPEKGGLELGPTRNQTRPEPEFEFSAKRMWSISNPQLRLRALWPDTCVQDRGTRKTGKDRKS